MRRPDFYHITERVVTGARVLDLACEDGALLNHLRHERRIDGIGVDMSSEQLTKCLADGLQVIHTDIRQGLSLFGDGAFDYVILSQTLQAINKPLQEVVHEMLRVGKTVIVSFPNFAYWRFRWQMLRGRMPVGGDLPYEWDNTPHVRYCTMADFDRWCAKQGLCVEDRIGVRQDGKAVDWLPNLRAATAIYMINDNSRS